MIYKLLAFGYNINVIGGPPLQEHDNLKAVNLPDGIPPHQTAIVLPMRGINEEGLVVSRWDNRKWLLNDDFWKAAADNTLLITVIQKNADQYHNIYLLNDNDVYANYNAVLTAEGAIEALMKLSKKALRGQVSYTLGYGRCGKALARLIDNLDMESIVVARRGESRAEAWRDGLQAIDYHTFEKEIKCADVIFNTVPALILTDNILSKMKHDTIIIDIASSPGGTDFTKANALGIKAVFVPGIPGKYAPLTAGEIMGECIHEVLMERGLDH